jgi:metallo-beta-lactamase class B
MKLLLVAVPGAAVALATSVAAQAPDPLTAPYPDCPSCVEWNQPRPPARLFGNTYYVGTEGLSSILITSPEGHVLIDGGLPDTAPLIIANIETLGFDIADVELILNSHAHYDHAGGIAALQQASGARVAASGPSAAVLTTGVVSADDPQAAIAFDFPAVRSQVERFVDGATVRVGALGVTAHLTPGHTPGGTTWAWQSCEAGRCLDFVYADSQTPVSADGFRYSDSPAYPNAVADFRRGHAVLESLRCDVLLTPHPSASRLWERAAAGADGLVDPTACRRYAQSAREQLDRRLATEAQP